LSPATSPTLLMLVLRGRPDFIWLLSITSIISPSISMLMMMWWEKTCPVWETPANDQSVALSHAIRLYWAWAPGAHFGSITFFVAWFLAK
jgi:hypothetical protein